MATHEIPDRELLDLQNRFSSHPVNMQQSVDMQKIRDTCLSLAVLIKQRVPPGREQSLALTHLEEVMFWGNAGISRS